VKSPRVPARSGAELCNLATAAAELSDRMRDYAQLANWDRVAELENERALLLGRLSTMLPTQGVSAAEAESLHGLLARNEEVLTICRAAREQLRAEMSEFAQRRKASQAYGKRV